MQHTKIVVFIEITMGIGKCETHGCALQERNMQVGILKVSTDNTINSGLPRSSQVFFSGTDHGPWDFQVMGHDYNLPFGPWGMEVEPQMPLVEQWSRGLG